MVGGAQAMESPKFARQDAVRVLIALAPPLVPNAAEIIVRSGFRAGQFGRQQTAQSEEPRLQGERLRTGTGPARTQFGQTLHRPDIVRVTQRAKESFPE